MRIGIVTQPLHTNYGGILQNYALQQVLKRMGHEVWTIDYNRLNWFDWVDCAWRVVVHKMLGHDKKFPITPPEKERQEMPLRRFVENYISLTEPRTRVFKRGIIKKYAFDAIVVGSDQVWRPRYNYDVVDCFLRFAKKLPLRRIAYAASFGTDKWELTAKQTTKCAALAKQFDGISVREKSAVKLCKCYLGVEAEYVFDPTLLLDSADYMELCKEISRRDPFVFAYILDKSEDKLRQIKDFAKRNRLGYLIKSAESSSVEDTVELWLSYFRDAAFVITDSFHGTVFSIIFNKDFYVFGNTDRGNSRFESLLSSVHIQSRILSGAIPRADSKIDWDEVNALREEIVHFSLNCMIKFIHKER